VTIPPKTTKIDLHAFESCYGLMSMTLPDSVTNIGESAFYGCSGLTNLVIGNGVASIGNYAFQMCSGLTSVTIGTNVTGIGLDVFYYCPSLTSVRIPNSVTNIGYDAFYYCVGLTNVVLGNGLTSISPLAFYDCTNLTSIAIPSSVTNIGYDAFLLCSHLTTACFLGAAPSVLENSTPLFVDGTNDSTIFMGHGTNYVLNTAAGWPTNGVKWGGWPVRRWPQDHPQLGSSGGGLGVATNGFHFSFSWMPGATLVVEVSTNLLSGVWSPVHTNTLPAPAGGANYTDPNETNVPCRFYRVRSQ
jgi:hypothetical protein